MFGAREGWDFARGLYRRNGAVIRSLAADPDFVWTRTTPTQVMNLNNTLHMVKGGAPAIGSLGLLLEEPRSTLLASNMQPSQTPFAAVNSTMAASAPGSYPGLNYFLSNSQFTEDSSTGEHGINAPVTAVNGSTYSLAVDVIPLAGQNFAYFKAGDGTNFYGIVLNTSTGATAIISSGTVTGCSAYVIQLANGWWRMYVIFKVVSGTTLTWALRSATGLSTVSFAGNTSHGLNYAYPDIQLGVMGTSPIGSAQTLTTLASRDGAATRINFWPGTALSPADQFYNALFQNKHTMWPCQPFTMFVELVAPQVLITGQTVVGTDLTPVLLKINNNAGLGQVGYDYNGSSPAWCGSFVPGADVRAAVSVDASGNTVLACNSTVSLPGANTLPAANYLTLGSLNGAAGSWLNSYVKRLLFFDFAMGAGQAAAITAVGE